MKSNPLTIIFFFLFFSSTSFAQEWAQYKSSDILYDFQLEENYLWTVSSSGLTRIDINTEEKTNWNALNSELLDYNYIELLIDDLGTVWLSGPRQHLMKLDGTSWAQTNFINGDSIHGIYDLQKSPDGKVWLYGKFNTHNLLYFENGIYQEIPSPADTLLYYTGFGSNIGVDESSHVWAIFKNENSQYRVLGEYDGSEWILHDLQSQGVSLNKHSKWLPDSQGNLYMLIPDFDEPNFLKYDGTDWTLMNLPTGTGIGELYNSERVAYMDADDHIWMSLWNNTFIEFNGQDWTTHEIANIGLEGGFADGLFIDDNNKQWIIYNHKVDDDVPDKTLLHSFDGTETKIIDLSNSDLPTNFVRRVLIDEYNNKWFASQNGILKFDGITWFDFPAATPTNLTDQEWLAGVGFSNNVWIQNYQSSLIKFDGVSFFEKELVHQDGTPISNGYNLAVNKNGKIYNATGEGEIIVFDHGEITYLDGMEYTLDNATYPDYSGHVGVDSFGNIYSLGYALNKYDGSSWTEIPLWTENTFGVNYFEVAPNLDIWVRDGFVSNNGAFFKIFDGINWEDFEAPFKVFTFPKWDNQGNIWFNTDQGICKKMGSDWICYNQTNSPLLFEKVMDFAFDQSDNIWIVLDQGGVMVFNENQIENIEAEKLFNLSGSIYQDLNQNEIKDTSDLSIGLQRVRLLPDSLTTFSYDDGTYRFSVPSGDYEVEFLENTDWVIDNSPSAYTVSVDTSAIGNLDFRVGVFVSIFNKEKNELELKVFPNPTSSEIFLSTTSSNFEKFQYKIFSAQGQIIQSGEINSDETKNIFLGNIPAGIYSIQVENKEKVGISRFVKN